MIRKTPKQAAIDHIKEIIDAGVDAVMPGCDLWPAIKEENMKAWWRPPTNTEKRQPGRRKALDRASAGRHRVSCLACS